MSNMYDTYKYTNKLGMQANPYSYITWNDSVVSKNCFTSTSVRFANLYAENKTSSVYVSLYVGIRQGEKYFGYYEDMNFDRDKLLRSIENLVQSDLLDHSLTRVEYPESLGVLPLNSRGEDELVILLTLEEGVDFMNTVQELMSE